MRSKILASMTDTRNAVSFEDIIAALKSERDYQMRRWGVRQPDGTIQEAQHSVSDWLVYMDDYLTEAKHNATREPGSTMALESLRKVVSLGVACFMQCGIRPRLDGAILNARDGLPA